MHKPAGSDTPILLPGSKVVSLCAPKKKKNEEEKKESDTPIWFIKLYFSKPFPATIHTEFCHSAAQAVDCVDCVNLTQWIPGVY